MINTILSRLPVGNGVRLPKWRRFLDGLQREINIRRRWYEIAPYQESGALRMLNNLIFRIETETLLDKDDDTDRYFSHIQYQADLSQSFDSTHFNRAFRNVFYKRTGGQGSAEILTPVRYQNVLDMPKDMTIDGWHSLDLSPVTILNEQAEELPEDLRGNEIFRRNQPDYGVFGINLPMIVLMWIAYVKEHGYEGKQNPEPFIHKYLFPGLFNELRDMWITNVIAAITTSPDRDSAYESIEKFGQQNWIPQYAFREGVDEVASLIFDVQEDEATISDFLETEIYPNGTVMEKISEMQKQNHLSMKRQYAYVHMLRDAPFVEILLDLIFYSTSSASYNASREAARKFREYERRNLVSMAPDVTLRTPIETYMTSMRSKLV